MPDRIEKEVLIRAPRSRVWRAIVDRTQFGEWFKCAFPPGDFVPGEVVNGKITYPGYEGLPMDIKVVDVVPEQRLSYRWVPYGVDPVVDFEKEPTTLVTFTLEDAPGGTQLRIVESGFDRIPADKRDEAYRMNEGGWAEQVQNVARYVTGR